MRIEAEGFRAARPKKASATRPTLRRKIRESLCISPNKLQVEVPWISKSQLAWVVFEMAELDKLALAEQKKLQGNEAFQKKDFEAAIELYSEV